MNIYSTSKHERTPRLCPICGTERDGYCPECLALLRSKIKEHQQYEQKHPETVFNDKIRVIDLKDVL